jgi:hypothetical protein
MFKADIWVKYVLKIQWEAQINLKAHEMYFSDSHTRPNLRPSSMFHAAWLFSSFVLQNSRPWMSQLERDKGRADEE